MPSQPQPAPRADTVTVEQLELFKKDIEQRTEWVLDEWYEKFSTLHARLAKRAKRANPSPPPPGAAVEEQEALPSVLHFRRPGSP